MLLLHALHFSMLIALARGWPSGAPAEACEDIYPTGHKGPSQDLQANPYRIDLTAFDELGGTLNYVYEQSYEIVLSGMSGKEFKGFLVQARALADNSPVGQFISLGPDQQLSDCLPQESAVTHRNTSLKTQVTLRWRAPISQSGQLKFLFSIVENINTFWAPAETITLHPCGLPLYESDGHCVETCPDGQFGNGNITSLTGTCDPLPSDYSVALNATVYYAQIYRNNPQSSPVFTVRAIISAALPQINSLVITLHEDENSNFFSGITPMVTRSEEDLVTNGDQRITDFSFLATNLNTYFNERDFPVEWYITIDLTVYLPSEMFYDTARGLVRICLSPDVCGNQPVESPTYCDELNPCSNGANCSEGGDSYYCDCTTCWTGENCTEIADECTEVPCTAVCLNGGTCLLRTESSESICDCVLGFTGGMCETKLPLCSVNYCKNGGTCFLVDDQSVCLCQPQFTGSRCETHLCEAEEDVPVYPGSSVRYSWPATEAGSRKTAPCPDICQEVIDTPLGAVVQRVCGRDSGQWLDTNITHCGLTLTTLQLCEASQLKSGMELAVIVLQVSSNALALESSTVTVIGSIIDNLTESAIEDPQVREAFLGIVDNVLDVSTSELLMGQTQANSSTVILQSVERFLEHVPLDSHTGNITFAQRNFGVIALNTGQSLYSTDSHTQPPLSFSAYLGHMETGVLYNNSATVSQEQVSVTSGRAPSTTNNGVLSLQDLGDRCSEGSRADGRVVFSAFRTNALFLTPETACNQSATGSMVLSVRRSGGHRNCTPQSVIVDLEQLNSVCRMIHGNVIMTENQESTCSHYDGVGKWSSANCKKISSSEGRTKCDCSQLGHFGLFFDLHPDEPLSPLALAVISYIGAGFSILCLSLFILTLLSSKRLRGKEHGRILIHVSLSLVCLYVVWVVAGLVTSVQPLCGLVAALFQYILLVFFGWTSAEAVFLYHKLVVVLGAPIKHYEWKAALASWLVPLLITVISVGSGYKYYINPYYCRATEWPFWLGLILPFAISNIFNWIVFAVIMTQLTRKKTAVRVHTDKRQNFRQNFFISVGLSLLLGLGWGFGLTATSSDLKELTFALQVIFSLFVGSQGVLIFVFHGLRSPQFRLVWTSAFGLRGKKGAQGYFTKKKSCSGAEFNTETTLSMREGSKQQWAAQNQQQVVFSTDTELGESRFEPVTAAVGETDKYSKECLQCEEECPPQEKGKVCPPQEKGKVCPPQEKGKVCPPQEKGKVCPPQEKGKVCPPWCREESPLQGKCEEEQDTP